MEITQNILAIILAIVTIVTTIIGSVIAIKKYKTNEPEIISKIQVLYQQKLDASRVQSGDGNLMSDITGDGNTVSMSTHIDKRQFNYIRNESIQEPITSDTSPDNGWALLVFYLILIVAAIIVAIIFFTNYAFWLYALAAAICAIKIIYFYYRVNKVCKIDLHIVEANYLITLAFIGTIILIGLLLILIFLPKELTNMLKSFSETEFGLSHYIDNLKLLSNDDSFKYGILFLFLRLATPIATIVLIFKLFSKSMIENLIGNFTVKNFSLSLLSPILVYSVFFVPELYLWLAFSIGDFLKPYWDGMLNELKKFTDSTVYKTLSNLLK